jgi:hypothetical protein
VEDFVRSFDEGLADEPMAESPIALLTGWEAVADVLALAAFVFGIGYMTGSAQTRDSGGRRINWNVIFEHERVTEVLGQIWRSRRHDVK